MAFDAPCRFIISQYSALNAWLYTIRIKAKKLVELKLAKQLVLIKKVDFKGLTFLTSGTGRVAGHSSD
ncbi:hypothetical protein CQA01_29910 [Cyclobacterium qasimii]|uniref:Uncharacterized protein n=1 Tax=Cyclobacterium qasimii TaxID=1350429 RepID=A0A512CE16_9BACT|nr:hypothetical protein CQA01_29910 [Cyclobacterium qasimii]